MNFKANKLMISDLVSKFDKCFVIEHWLGSDDSFYFNDICSYHSIIFNSDYANSVTRRGRPFGGKCWVIHNRLRIVEHTELSNSISKIILDVPNFGHLCIFGIWQPFDDGSHDKLASAYTSISILETEIENCVDFVIIGDFNADFYNRKKSFDILFKNFLDPDIIDLARHFKKFLKKFQRILKVIIKPPLIIYVPRHILLILLIILIYYKVPLTVVTIGLYPVT